MTKRIEADLAMAVAGPELPEIVVYEHNNFNGAHRSFYGGILFVGSEWNDRVSSVIVVRGRWQLFEHRDYGGGSTILGVGYYGAIEDHGLPNDSLSSLKPV